MSVESGSRLGCYDKQFLMGKVSANRSRTRPSIIVVQNWLEEVKQRVNAAR